MSAPASGVAESMHASEKEQATKRLIIFHLIPGLLNLFILVKIIPVYAEVYRGFGMKLPAMIQFVIQLSHIVQQRFLLITLPVCGAWLLLDVVAHRVIMNSLGKGAARIWTIGVFVALILLACGIVIMIVTVPFSALGPAIRSNP
jgi:type II secretory pathway component PulF